MSVGSRRFYGGNGDSDNDNNDGKDDDSSDTYVSVSTKGGKSHDEKSISKAASTALSSSSQGKIFRDSPPNSISESSRVRRETSRASNMPMILRSSSTSSNVVGKMKNQYERYGGKSSSSTSSTLRSWMNSRAISIALSFCGLRRSRRKIFQRDIRRMNFLAFAALHRSHRLPLVDYRFQGIIKEGRIRR